MDGYDEGMMRRSTASCSWGGCHGQGCTEDGDHPIASYTPRGPDERYFEELVEVDFDDDEKSESYDEMNEIRDCYFPQKKGKSDYYCHFDSFCNCYYYFPRLPPRPNYLQGLNISSLHWQPQLEEPIAVRNLREDRWTGLTTFQGVLSTRDDPRLFHEDSKLHKPRELPVDPTELYTCLSLVYSVVLSTPEVEGQPRTVQWSVVAFVQHLNLLPSTFPWPTDWIWSSDWELRSAFHYQLFRLLLAVVVAVKKNGQGLWEGKRRWRLLRRKKNRLSQLCEWGSKDDEEDKNCTSRKIPPFDYRR